MRRARGGFTTSASCIARSAGLSGAFAARGVRRGDVVMTLVGSRVEWVLALLACWRMGAVALPCNPQLRRKDLELRVAAANPKLAVGEARYLGELPDGIPYMDMDDVAAVLDEDRAQETPAPFEALDPADPAAIVFTSGTTGEPRGRRLPTALPGRPAPAGRALVRRPRRRDRLVHGGPRLVEVDPQRLHRPLAGRRRRGPARRALRPRGAAAPLRRAGCQRALPGADRVPDAGQAVGAGAGPVAAPPRIRRRADRAGGDPPLRRAARVDDRRRLRPNRDGAGDAGCARARTIPPATARWAGRCRGWRRASSTASCSCERAPPPPSSSATSTGSASRASGGRPATGSARTKTATSGSRAAATT